MDMDNTNGNRSFEVFKYWLYLLLPFLVVVSVIVAVVIYRINFGGELSIDADAWSAFGSYIGGLFGPLISFFTLLVVLKTVHLQKELLDTQRREFSSMKGLQDKTFERQENQIRDAAQEVARTKISEFKGNQLQLISRLIDQNMRYIELISAREADLLKITMPMSTRAESSDRLSKEMEKRKEKTNELLVVFVELSSRDDMTVDEIRKACGDVVIKAFK